MASLDGAAARLVADLMPIAVGVHGCGAEAWIDALRSAGAEAELWAADVSFDLTVLLTDGPPDPEALLPVLTASGDRLLFVPEAPGAATADSWFELFGDQGFQPVVEYDAAYLGPGAFLVDRNATAADSDMASFAARVAAEPAPVVAAMPPAGVGELEALRADLAASRAATEAAAEALRREVAAWESVGVWSRAVCADPGHNTLEALRYAAGGPVGRVGWLARLLGRGQRMRRAERVLLADAALVRASRHFDAAWYIALHPELAERGDDPVWHYLLRGAAACFEPGPEFDSTPWRARFPDRNPLAEAERQA